MRDLGKDPHELLGRAARRQALELRDGETVLQCVVHEQRGGGVQVPAPVVGCDFGSELPVVRNQLRVEKLAALKSVLPQHPAAEAVDGRDGGLVEAAERLGQAPAVGRPVAGPLQQPLQERVL